MPTRGTNVRKLIRRCKATVDQLDLPEPFDVTELCRRTGKARGRPITVAPMPLRGASPCGLWLGPPSTDLIFFEADTGTAAAGVAPAPALVPTAPSTVDRAVPGAARSSRPGGAEPGKGTGRGPARSRRGGGSGVYRGGPSRTRVEHARTAVELSGPEHRNH